MPEVTHRLFGKVTLNVLVDEEDDCRHCQHAPACSHKMDKFCLNYQFGSSDHYGSCASCHHRFTRYAEDKILCFKCKWFEKENRTMIAFAELLSGPAFEAGIRTPLDCDDYDAEKYPHWHVFLNVQLGRPMPQPTSHWNNAKIVAAVPEEKLKTITLDELITLGLE